jgi:xylan 1,4-beta-xylosidase
MHTRFAELSSMPDALAPRRPSAPDLPVIPGLNSAEPADSRRNPRQLLSSVTSPATWSSRYGIGEVAHVAVRGVERPNIPFFAGDEQAYFELYQPRRLEAIKGVDAQLKVGGPATSAGQLSLGEPRAPGPEYYRRFMERVEAANVPIDFGLRPRYETDTGGRSRRGGGLRSSANPRDTPGRAACSTSPRRRTS